MPHEPTVVCIMLTKDRPELARKAVECFRSQTYENKTLLVVNSGIGPLFEESNELREPPFVGADTLSIGELRNLGCKYASHHYILSSTRPEIFIHFDDDDWSHPNRIAEQVELLQSSGADVVGYNEMLFWRFTQEYDSENDEYMKPGEAWLYTATKGCVPALGTSLCYWRKTWERNPFPDLPKRNDKGETVGMSEYGNWLKALKCKAISSLGHFIDDHREDEFEPLMIARLHAANARAHYNLEDRVARGSNEWKRASEWDERVRGILG